MKIELLLHVSGSCPAVLLTPGIARNISVGGMNCAVDLAVQTGTHVSVHFSHLPEGVAVDPGVVSGTVVRTEPMGQIPGRVAIEFSEPLSRLELAPDEMAGAMVSYPGPDTNPGVGFGCATTFGRVFR
jgi:hypothetical protein